MKWPTHQLGGALCGLVAASTWGLPTDEATALTVGSFAASITPDVDAKLRIGRSYDHRSLPHSLIFGGLGSILLAFLAYNWLTVNAPSTAGDVIPPGTVALLAPGAAIGYLSHLALDAMNPSGVWLFMPKGRRIGLPREKAIRTGSFKELVMFVLLMAALAVALIVYFGGVSDVVETSRGLGLTG